MRAAVCSPGLHKTWGRVQGPQPHQASQRKTGQGLKRGTTRGEYNHNRTMDHKEWNRREEKPMGEYNYNRTSQRGEEQKLMRDKTRGEYNYNKPWTHKEEST